MSWLLGSLWSFLATNARKWPFLSRFTSFLRSATHNIFHHFLHHLQHPARLMAALRRDSKHHVADLTVQRRMVHLKTKEECRLSKETIQVWTIELPSKHAEGILKCADDHPAFTSSH
jgi:tRNA-specific adenosine deaminase 3